MNSKSFFSSSMPICISSTLFLLVSACAPESPLPSFEKISDNLYRINDACNVYVVKRGGKALLIDSGDAHVLELMQKLGIRNIEWVLHTHSHRDQCQGTPRLVEAGAKVAVPQKEGRFFADAEGFWNNFQLFYRYSYKPDNFKPRENIPVHRTLADGEVFEWEGLRFETVETPGHTVGAVSYVVEIDGTRCAFTGDMIHSPGKVWNLYSFDHKYWDGGYQGIVEDLEGLDRVLAKGVDKLLPSHGLPISEPRAAVEALRANLEKLYDFEFEEESSPAASSPARPSRWWKKVSEHLYHYRPTSFIVLSQDSSALFYDYYAVPDSGSPYYYDTIDEVIAGLGIKNVELVIPSHFHEDHIRGFLDLKKRFGTSIWVFENMTDILENPSRYNLPCLAEESIKADRILHDHESFRWKEYVFTVVHFPGQTMYHQGMTGTVDGKKVFFVGDTDVYRLDDPNFDHRNKKLHGISTFLNYYLLEPEGGYVQALNRLVEFDPEILLFGHSGAKPGNMEMYLRNRVNIKQRIEAVADVLPYGDPNLGFDPNWVSFYPYSARIKPGVQFDTRVQVRNHYSRAMNADIELRVPAGWQVEPPRGQIVIPAKGEEALSFKVRVISQGRPKGRTVITAQVKTEERDWGEFAEMLLDWE
ncbi:MAG TPA: MBL fold metallo-hydrolase [archaeon]|nr:MBL fold metallo-hydrolase [archaeon]